MPSSSPHAKLSAMTDDTRSPAPPPDDPPARLRLLASIGDLQRVLAEHGAADAKAAEDRTRASVVAFLVREADRFHDAGAKANVYGRNEDASNRLFTQSSLLRTIAGQIARGDDKTGEAAHDAPA